MLLRMFGIGVTNAIAGGQTEGLSQKSKPATGSRLIQNRFVPMQVTVLCIPISSTLLTMWLGRPTPESGMCSGTKVARLRVKN